MKNDFLKRYDDGSFRFDPVDFRVGAERELGFDIFIESAGDYKKEKLSFPDKRPVYIHFGIDRSAGQIICPFDSFVKWHESVPGYGTLLRLFPEGADFEIRIAHMDRPSFGVRRALLDDSVVKAGVSLGKTGSQGTGTGPHSHVEIVSIGSTSEICDTILEHRKYDLRNTIAESEDRMNHEEKSFFRDYCNARDLILFNNHKCIRNDGFIPKGRVTYYSSRSLFGM